MIDNACCLPPGRMGTSPRLGRGRKITQLIARPAHILDRKTEYPPYWIPRSYWTFAKHGVRSIGSMLRALSGRRGKWGLPNKLQSLVYLFPKLPASPKFLMQTPFTKPLCIFMQFRRRCNSRSLIFPSWKKVAVDYVQFAPNRR